MDYQDRDAVEIIVKLILGVEKDPNKLAMISHFCMSVAAKISQTFEHPNLPDDPDMIPIDELDLSYRAMNCLQTINCTTLGELSEYSLSAIASIPNCGRKTTAELDDHLLKHGLRFQGILSYSAINRQMEINTENFRNRWSEKYDG